MSSALVPVESCDALRTTSFTSPVRATDLPKLSLQEIRSFPAWVTVECQGCGIEFKRQKSSLADSVRKGSTRIYCTKKCASQAARVAVTCAQCGNEFKRTRGESEKAKRNGWTTTLCSVQCRSEHERTRSLAARRKCRHCGNAVPHRKRVFCSDDCLERHYEITLKCEQCEGEFAAKRAEVAKRERAGKPIRYCSKTCMGMAYRTSRCANCGQSVQRKKYCSTECRSEAAKSRANRRKLSDRVCTECGRIFKPKSSRHTYCDRYCANSAHSKRMIGTGNGRYTHGMSYNKLFRLIRPKILLRDELKCVACGTPNRTIEVKREGKDQRRMFLVVHHINEDVRDNTPENLIALCHRCHMIHHHSKSTPFPWFAEYAEKATASMTSKWKDSVTSLLRAFSSTTAP